MIHKIKHIVFIALAVFMASCESFLDEEPKALLTAKYLETESGVNSALFSVYSDLRYFYGGEGGLNVTCAGTDEWQKGPDGSVATNTYTAAMANEGTLLNTWDWGYTAINTVNGVLKYAAASGMTESEYNQVIAEARYLRATWYFMMVQTYGDCPLHTEFISTPTTVDYRALSSLVYDTIVGDLEKAKLALPITAVQPGRATRAAAYHLLSKVYLTRATHATAKKTTDYQSAYNNAIELINNKATYGLDLLPDFADVHKDANEYSKEVIFRVERNTNKLYNDLDPNTSGNKNNRSSFFFRPNYSTWVDGLVRDINYGRPWHRLRPTNYLLEVVFKDKTDDTRYDKTFQTVWLVNKPESLKDLTFKAGDTAAWMPGSETYRKAKALKIYPPSEYYGNTKKDGTVATLSIYPSLKKFDDKRRPDIADASVRPFIVYRFAETYLIAAEAAMYLNDAPKAVELINIIRTRAVFSTSRSATENALALQRVLTKTPDMTDKEVGISFILDERSRELAGEYMRWWDLARTRTTGGTPQLLQRINNLVPACPATGLVKADHILRPIPTASQRDLLTNKDEFPQNPGY